MVTTTDQKAMLKKHMEDIGVSPKAAIPIIVDAFFSGDINELSWLDHVLTKEAGGVAPHQRRLLIAWWAAVVLKRELDDDFLVWLNQR